MNDREAIEWLFSSQLFGIKLGLENTTRLLTELELLPLDAKVLHIAGTNGKGSTCAFADSILRAAGVRTGLFTSPHLIRFNERSRVDGVEIANEEVTQSITQIRRTVADWDPHPTFFEMTLAIGLQHFVKEACEVIILETGMGGRLDATTAVPPQACAITPIALDHRQWLGDDIATIAAEKAGILRPRIPAVSSPQTEAAQAVLQTHASELPCPLTFIPHEPLGADPELGLIGPHQRDNAALAIALLDEAGLLPVDPTIVRRGLREARWPARFDRRPLPAGRTLVIDGAHNAHAATALAETWQEQYPNQQIPIVFGSVEGKDTEEVLRQLSPIASRFIFTRIDSPRTLQPEFLADLTDLPSTLIDDPADAITEALTDSDLALLTGSLFLAGQAIAIIDEREQQTSSQ